MDIITDNNINGGANDNINGGANNMNNDNGANNMINDNGANNMNNDNGTQVSTSLSILSYCIIGVMIVFIIYLIYLIFEKFIFGKETYYQRNLRYNFNNLHGEAFDEEAKRAIEYGEYINNPTAMDHYRLGTVYLINGGDPYKANQHFRQALLNITQNKTDNKENLFIIDRIDDYKDMFTDFPDIEELPIQQALMAQFENHKKLLEQIIRKKPDIKPDDPEYKQKLILSKQAWNSDSQNVHDSLIYSDLEFQFNKIMNENSCNTELLAYDYENLKDWLESRYKNNIDKLDKIRKVLKFINNNYPIKTMNGVREQDILTTIWKRIHDQNTPEKQLAMKEAVADALIDCVEGDSVVCIDGRLSKVWQALARMDKDQDIGVLKTKQALRNEIYERCAKIINDYIGDNGTVSPELKESYNKNEDNEQVRELAEAMRKQIEHLKEEYADRLPKEQLEMIISECCSIL